MTTEQPLALKLADQIEHRWDYDVTLTNAATELRRLHAENIELAAKVRVAESGFHAAVQTAKWQESTNRELNRHIEQKAKLRAENMTLQEALESMLTVGQPEGLAEIARAALARAGEKT